MKLPYYNSITMTAVDPMHCLYLGVAKHMFMMWREDGTLDDKILKKIDQRLIRIDGSTRIGSLPKRLSLRTKLTADEWKNWTMYYSLIVLHDVLPKAKMLNWLTFVKACRIISKPVVSQKQLKLVDALLSKFGKEFTSIYGFRKVTPNMHFACHITESVANLGSIYTYWLFAFERYNGFLGKFTSNGRDIEQRLMRVMCLEREVYRIGHELRLEIGNYNAILQEWSNKMKLEVKQASMDLYAMTSLPTHMCTHHWTKLDSIVIPKRMNVTTKHIDEDDLMLLCGTYSVMYPDANIVASDLCKFGISLKYIEIAGEMFASKNDKRRGRYSRIMASWFDRSGVCLDNMSFRAGSIKCIFKHSFTIGGETKTHIMAAVEWNKYYPFELNFHPPVSVYYKSRFEHASLASFIPVQRINCSYIAEDRIEGRTAVIVANPVERKWFL